MPQPDPGPTLWLSGEHDFQRAGEGIGLTLWSGDQPLRFHLSRHAFRMLVEKGIRFADDLDDAAIIPFR